MQGYWFANDGIIIGHPEKYCLGDLSQTPDIYGVITSILLLIEPNQALFNTMQEYFGAWIYKNGKPIRQYFDMDIINQRLACHAELVVLPKHYGTLNSEYLKNEKLGAKMRACKMFQNVKFMHFSGLGKPWSHTLSIYIKKYEKVAQPLIKTWIKYAKKNMSKINQIKIFAGLFDISRPLIICTIIICIWKASAAHLQV